MTIVVWDGRILAADRRAVCAGLRTQTQKIVRVLAEGVAAFTGNQAAGLAMVRWVDMGGEFPKIQSTEDWSRLIVLTSGEVAPLVYENTEVPIPVLESYMAWGSGRDYALGAMYQGATAIEAVRVASEFDVSCGDGVDYWDSRNPDKIMRRDD